LAAGLCDLLAGFELRLSATFFILIFYL